MTTNIARWDWDEPDELSIDEDFGDEFADEPDFDCGFVPGDGCQLVGTEDCDFECPQRDALLKHPDYPNYSFLAPTSFQRKHHHQRTNVVHLS
jgi:hypothetical protein